MDALYLKLMLLFFSLPGPLRAVFYVYASLK